MTRTAEVVICGAGIAGNSAAYHLAVRHGIKDVVLVDERPPLSLTSANSAECYRNWWPGPGDAMEATALGAGPMRIHGNYPGLENIEGLMPYMPSPADGFEGQLTGADGYSIPNSSGGTCLTWRKIRWPSFVLDGPGSSMCEIQISNLKHLHCAQVQVFQTGIVCKVRITWSHRLLLIQMSRRVFSAFARSTACIRVMYFCW
jgi:hypothetical protein